MTVRLRLKQLGRRHRPFFRLCAMDQRSPRDGRVIEELGYYDPMVRETDARAILDGERIDYWLSVGAQPSDKAKVLIKKYGKEGTHLEQQKAALDRLQTSKPMAPPPVAIPKSKQDEPAPPAEEAEAAGGEEAAAEATEEAAAEAPAEEATAEEATAEAKSE